MDFKTLENLLKKPIRHAKIEIIGKSVLERPIYAIKFVFGNRKTAIIQAGIHAREHITVALSMKMVYLVSSNFEKFKKLGVPNLIIVPLANPDGNMLCYHGLRSVKNGEKRLFLEKINGGADFSLYKANANGVDLNTNFDAKWGTGKANVFFPSSHGFVGECPESEPCTKALVSLCKNVKPFFTISYHCKGEEVYYDFFNKKENLKRDKTIAKMVVKSLKYKLVKSESVSSGGFKDWCVCALNIPSVTIEVGSDKLSHPIMDDKIDVIYKRNFKIIKLLAKILKEFEKHENRRRKISKQVYEKCPKACKKSV